MPKACTASSYPYQRPGHELTLRGAAQHADALYTNDLMLLAPNSSDLKTALMELERVVRKWGMAVNYPKSPCPRQKICPASRRRRHRRHDPSWIQQRGSQASVQVCG